MVYTRLFTSYVYPYQHQQWERTYPNWEPYPIPYDEGTSVTITTWITCMNCMTMVESHWEFCPYCGQRFGPEPVDEMAQKMDEILEELRKFNEFQEILKKIDSGEALKHMKEIFEKYEELIKDD